MITSITFQFSYNKKFVNPATQKGRKVYGERNTNDLEMALHDDINFLQNCHDLVTDLNIDLLTCRIQEKVREHFGIDANVTAITKRKRNYFIGGLTITEEDQTG
jgi:hypothetical protein